MNFLKKNWLTLLLTAFLLSILLIPSFKEFVQRQILMKPSLEKVENDSRSRKVVIDKTNHFSNDKKDYIVKLFDIKVEVVSYQDKKDEKTIEDKKKYSIPLLGDFDENEVDEL